MCVGLAGVQALMLEHEDRHDSVRQDSGGQQATTFYEVTVASVDQPKLLSRLSEALVGSPATTALPRFFLLSVPHMLPIVGITSRLHIRANCLSS